MNIDKSFLQSENWLDFQKSLGRKVWRIGGVGIIKYNLPFKKSYFYAPHCPANFLSGDSIKEIKELAKKENSIFFKIEPAGEADAIDLIQHGFIKSRNIQPQKTIILDIAKSEQELLSQMHYKTRYNIQLAQKKNIEIKCGKQYFEDFWKLIRQTAKRDKFHSHPKNYYEKMLEIPGVELFIVEYDGKIIAANIVVFYPSPLAKGEGQAIYLHGASDYEYRNLMAPYLLQWEQIKEAKQRGCVDYDFWGIDEKKWPGVTRFKRGFNGTEIIYPRAYDLVFRPIWYQIYKIARKIL